MISRSDAVPLGSIVSTSTAMDTVGGLALKLSVGDSWRDELPFQSLVGVLFWADLILRALSLTVCSRYLEKRLSGRSASSRPPTCIAGRHSAGLGPLCRTR